MSDLRNHPTPTSDSPEPSSAGLPPRILGFVDLLPRDIPGFDWEANQNRQTKEERERMHKHAGIYKYSANSHYPYEGGPPSHHGCYTPYGCQGPPFVKNGWFAPWYASPYYDGDADCRQHNVAGLMKVLYINPVETGDFPDNNNCPETDNQGCARDYNDYYDSIDQQWWNTGGEGGGGIIRIEAVKQPYSYSHAANYSRKSELYDTHPLSDSTKTWAEYRFTRLGRTPGGAFCVWNDSWLEYLDGNSPEPHGAGMPDMALHYLGTTSFEPSGWCRGSIDDKHHTYSGPHGMIDCGEYYCQDSDGCRGMTGGPQQGKHDEFPLSPGGTLIAGDLCHDIPSACCCIRGPVPWYYYVHVIPDIPTGVSPPTCDGEPFRNKPNRPLKKSNIERQKFWERYLNDT